LTLLDSYAVVAYLLDEPAAEHVRRVIRHQTARITATGLGEVFDQVVRVYGVDEEQLVLDLAEIGLLDAEPVDSSIGAAAGRLRARHYHRTRCPLSMADCQVAETARSLNEPLATSDPPLLTVCHVEGIAVLPLPQRDGSTWQPPRAPRRGQGE